MIVNFRDNMTFEIETTFGAAVIEPLRCGKHLCMGIEFAGVGDALEVLPIKSMEFAGVNSVIRGQDGCYRWPLRGDDGNEYEAVMSLPAYAPQLIEIPALRARYFAEVSGGLFQAGGRREIGRLGGR